MIAATESCPGKKHPQNLGKILQNTCEGVQF